MCKSSKPRRGRISRPFTLTEAKGADFHITITVCYSWRNHYCFGLKSFKTGARHECILSQDVIIVWHFCHNVAGGPSKIYEALRSWLDSICCNSYMAFVQLEVNSSYGSSFFFLHGMPFHTDFCSGLIHWDKISSHTCCVVSHLFPPW